MTSTIYSNVNKYGITTKISRGRTHFTRRLATKAVDTYEYTVKYGDSFYSLASTIFGDDKYWWVLADLNKIKEGFVLNAGSTIKLPYSIVADTGGQNRIF